MRKIPLLSICIPTYNRAEYLIKCINSIVCQSDFDDRVEIIISDNCSTDSTELEAKKLANLYTNIKYFKNQNNIFDENHLVALKRGSGLLRKLSNDTIIYKDGSLKYILDLIEKYKFSRPVIYLHNHKNIKFDEEILLLSLDEFIRQISYRITWIGSICIWNDGLERLKIYSEHFDSRLAHVPYILNEIHHRKRVLISNRVLMSSCSVKKKDLTYGLYKVFYENLLEFINEYRLKEVINYDTYKFIKKDLLLNFLCLWCAISDSRNYDYKFSDESLLALVSKECRKEPYYIAFIFKYNYFLLKEKIKSVKKILFVHFHKKNIKHE